MTNVCWSKLTQCGEMGTFSVFWTLIGAWPSQEGRRFRDSTIAGRLGAPASIQPWAECEKNLSRYVTDCEFEDGLRKDMERLKTGKING